MHVSLRAEQNHRLAGAHPLEIEDPRMELALYCGFLEGGQSGSDRGPASQPTHRHGDQGTGESQVGRHFHKSFPSDSDTQVTLSKSVPRSAGTLPFCVSWN